MFLKWANLHAKLCICGRKVFVKKTIFRQSNFWGVRGVRHPPVTVQCCYDHYRMRPAVTTLLQQRPTTSVENVKKITPCLLKTFEYIETKAGLNALQLCHFFRENRSNCGMLIII